MMWQGIKRGMHTFGENIGLIVNTLLLAIVYLVGVGITAIIAKIAGKQFIETSLQKKSYWNTLNIKKRSKETYYRQF